MREETAPRSVLLRGSRRVLATTLFSWLLAVAHAHNGYVLEVSSPSQIAAIKAFTLDTRDANVADLARGFSIGAWIRFNDVSPLGRARPSVQIATRESEFFMMPWAGTDANTQFSARHPHNSVKALGTGAYAWHHYATSWDAATGERFEYLDGQLVWHDFATTYGTDWMDGADPRLSIGMGCGDYYWDHDKIITCDPDLFLDGEVDDVGIWTRALSPAQMAERWNASLSNRIADGLEPDLLLFYNFNDDPSLIGDTVRNLGTAGAKYDLALGRIAGEAAFATHYERSGTVHAFRKPLIVESSDPRSWSPASKDVDRSAPLVLSAAAGETVSINAYGVTHTLTAPSPFTGTAVTTATDADGDTVTIHVLPQVPPTSFNVSVEGFEDEAVYVKLPACSRLVEGVEFVISSLPSRGRLYDTDFVRSGNFSQPIEATGYTLTHRARYVLYMPDSDAAGVDFDSFGFRARLKLHGLLSPEHLVTLSIHSVNDRPVVLPVLGLDFAEDSLRDGLLIDVAAADAEAGQPLTLTVHGLPRKGRLYLTSDGTLSGNRTQIEHEFEPYDGNHIFAQYADHIVGVSSFDEGGGDLGELSAAYHPLNVIGPPDCHSYGNCEQEASSYAQQWVADPDAYPWVGAHVRHADLVATVIATHPDEGTVDIQYQPLYKYAHDGTPQLCVVEPTLALKNMSGCMHAERPLNATVARASLRPMLAGVWAPKHAMLVEGQMSGGGMFGPEFKFDWNQIPAFLYSKPAYTEWISVGLATAVFVSSIEMGFSRGMGAVVSIKALAPSGEYLSLYSGEPMPDVYNLYTTTVRYWTWAVPNLCRSSFRTSTIRIEINTAAIEESSKLDYVRVFGSTEMQPASLPFNTTKLVYVPDPHADGIDEIYLAATDCLGNQLRDSNLRRVQINITAVNDHPQIRHTLGTPGQPGPSTPVASPGGRLELELPVFDVEDAAEVLEVVVTSVTDAGTLYTLDGTRIGTGGCPLPCTLTSAHVVYQASSDFEDFNASAAFLDAHGFTSAVTGFDFSVRDRAGATTSSTQLIIVRFALPCEPGYILKVDSDDGEITRRCEPCPRGTYQGVDEHFGTSVCIAVDARHYSSEPAAVMADVRACPANTLHLLIHAEADLVVSSAASKTDALIHCACEDGFYMTDHGCLPCPDGAYCFGGVFPPIAKRGHGTVGDARGFFMCNNHDVCLKPFTTVFVKEKDQASTWDVYMHLVLSISGYVRHVSKDCPGHTELLSKPATLSACALECSERADCVAFLFTEPDNCVLSGSCDSEAKMSDTIDGCDCLGGNLYADTFSGYQPWEDLAPTLQVQRSMCAGNFLQGSPLCSDCSEQRGSTRWALQQGLCTECKLPEGAYLFCAILMVLCWFPLLRELITKWFRSCYTSVSYIQYLGQYSFLPVDWGPSLNELFRTLAYFNLSLDAIHLGCGGFDWVDVWVFQMVFVPLIYPAVVILSILFDLSYAALATRDLLGTNRLKRWGFYPRRDFSPKALVERYLPAGLFFVNIFLYGGVTSAFSMVLCEDDGEGGQYLSRYPALKCWEGRHSRWFAVAVVALCFFLLVVPMVFCYFLLVFVPRHGINSFKSRKMCGFLYLRFLPELWYWEIIELTRKLLFGAVVALGPAMEAETQLVIALFSVLIVLCGELATHPFRSRLYDLLEELTTVCEFIMLIAGTAMHNRQVQDTTGGEEDTFLVAMRVVVWVCVIISFSMMIFVMLVDMYDHWIRHNLRKLRARTQLQLTAGLFNLDVANQLLLDYVSAADQKRISAFREFESTLYAALFQDALAGDGRSNSSRFKKALATEPYLIEYLLAQDCVEDTFVGLINGAHVGSFSGYPFSSFFDMEAVGSVLRWLSETSSTSERKLVDRVVEDVHEFEREHPRDTPAESTVRERVGRWMHYLTLHKWSQKKCVEARMIAQKTASRGERAPPNEHASRRLSAANFLRRSSFNLGPSSPLAVKKGRKVHPSSLMAGKETDVPSTNGVKYHSPSEQVLHKLANHLPCHVVALVFKEQDKPPAMAACSSFGSSGLSPPASPSFQDTDVQACANSMTPVGVGEFESRLCVPVMDADGDVIGVIVCSTKFSRQTDRVGAPFTDKDLRLSVLFARLVANMLQQESVESIGAVTSF